MILRLSDTAEIRSSYSGDTLGFYVGGELHHPLGVLEEHLVKRLLKSEAERDALAAHVERLRIEWEKKDAHILSNREKLDALVLLLYSEPTTSFAILKARWQAEALEDLATHCRSKAHLAAEVGHMIQADAVCDVADDANDRADELRRQAEENTQ